LVVHNGKSSGCHQRQDPPCVEETQQAERRATEAILQQEREKSSCQR
jgi:hypothetical protein